MYHYYMDLKKLSDEELALFMQNHNGDGIEEVINRYQPKLLRYIIRLISDEEMAEDVLQNTFISAYQNINSYNSSRPFSPWIYRISHNKAINELRNQKGKISLEMVAEVADPKSLEINDQLDKKRLREYLERSLDKLSLRYREVLILRFFEEKSYEEISEILKLPVGTVGVRIKRGLEKLKLKVDIKLEDYE